MVNGTGAYLLHTILYLTNTWFSPAPFVNVTLLEEPINDPFFENETMVCYGMYGCFSTLEPWLDTRRPVCNKPGSPLSINATFCLLTRYNPTDCQYLDFLNHTSIYHSFYVPAHKTYTVTHGYLEDGEKPWLKNMSRELLKHEDANVIIIGWGGGSVPPYTQAVANTRVVGREAALLIYTLTVLTGTSTKKFHLIGHSLGAHISGYIGYTLKHHFNLTVGRITGMDPAEPHFADTQGIVRLDTSDASFVDIIHTNARLFLSGGLGMNAAIGHIDYFPNNGDNQPGCDEGMVKFIRTENDSMVAGLRKFFSCDHVRSHEYMMHSINKCTFLSVECESWEKFLAGDCFPCKSSMNHSKSNSKSGALCARMGLPASTDYDNQHLYIRSSLRKLNQFYTITDSEKPYCSTLYRVTLHISGSPESYQHRGEIGVFSVSIHGTKGSTKMTPILKDQYFPPNSTHVYVMGGRDVGIITNASLFWEHRTTLNVITWRIDPYLHVGDIALETFTDAQRIHLCPEREELLASRSTMQMVPCPAGKPQLLHR